MQEVPDFCFHEGQGEEREPFHREITGIILASKGDCLRKMEEKDSSIEALDKKLQEFLDSERMQVMKNIWKRMNVKGFVKTCLLLS